MTFYPDPSNNPQDEYAPVDYSYVPSVTEGRRREQQQKMHRAPGVSGPIVRHRAEPKDQSDLPEYRVHAVASAPKSDPRVMKKLPSLTDDPVPVQSVAYPDEYGIPDNPFQPSPEMQQPRRRRAQAEPQPQPVAAPAPAEPQGPQFDAPVSPEIPDWLRVAQQNNMPLQNRPQGPRVTAAPRQAEVPVDALGRPLRRRPQPVQTASPYEEAGYPQELVEAQRQMEAELAAQPIRRRHGAQYAQRPQYPSYAPVQPQQPSGMSYPPPRAQMPAPAPEDAPPVMQRSYMHQPQPQQPEDWRVEEEEYEEDERDLEWFRRVPWLGIAAFVAVLIPIILFVLTRGAQTQTQQVLEERAAKQQAIVEAHPIRYEDILTSTASRYNLSPAFVAAIMLNESSFRPDATAESTGARGLMQLMDETAEWIHGKLDWAEPYSFDLMYDPATNAEFGCWYLNYLSGLFNGDPILVAAAFHAGQGEVRNWLNSSEYSADGRTIRLENMIEGNTKRYVTRVLSAFAVYKRLYFGG